MFRLSYVDLMTIIGGAGVRYLTDRPTDRFVFKPILEKKKNGLKRYDDVF